MRSKANTHAPQGLPPQSAPRWHYLSSLLCLQQSLRQNLISLIWERSTWLSNIVSLTIAFDNAMCAQGDDYEGLQWRCSLLFVSGNYITFTVSKIMMIHYPKRFSPRWKSMSTRLVKSQYDAMITSSMFSMKFFVYWSWWRNWKDDEEDTKSQWCALICWFHTSRFTILNSILHLKILYHDLITPKVLILFATVLESYSASLISNHLTSKWYGQSLSHYLNEIFSLNKFLMLKNWW